MTCSKMPFRFESKHLRVRGSTFGLRQKIVRCRGPLARYFISKWTEATIRNCVPRSLRPPVSVSHPCYDPRASQDHTRRKRVYPPQPPPLLSRQKRSAGLWTHKNPGHLSIVRSPGSIRIRGTSAIHPRAPQDQTRRTRVYPPQNSDGAGGNSHPRHSPCLGILKCQLREREVPALRSAAWPIPSYPGPEIDICIVATLNYLSHSHPVVVIRSQS